MAKGFNLTQIVRKLPRVQRFVGQVGSQTAGKSFVRKAILNNLDDAGKLSDEAMEAINKNVDSKWYSQWYQEGDSAVKANTAAREAKAARKAQAQEIYDTQFRERMGGKIREARTPPSGEASNPAEDAINRRAYGDFKDTDNMAFRSGDTTWQRMQNPNYKNGSDVQYVYSSGGKSVGADDFNKAAQAHADTGGSFYGSAEDIARANAESGPGAFSGIGEWMKQHQLITAGAIVGGAMLLTNND